MLLKWAVEGKRKSRLREAFRTPHIDDSICTAPSSASISEPLDTTEGIENNQTSVVSEGVRATDPGKNKITMERLVSEEQAIILRDEKLMEASNPNPRQLSISMPPTPSSLRIKLPTPALTFENMALLSREFEVNPFELLNFDMAKDDDESDSSESTERGSASDEDATRFEPRMDLMRNSSSETTVILRPKRLHR